MSKRRTITGAFTLVELIVVISIVMILSGAAMSGASGVIKSSRFTNAFNKMVFMVQNARSLALAGKDADVEKYEVRVSTVADQAGSYRASFVSVKAGNAESVLDSVALPNVFGLRFTGNAGNSSCAPLATIRFYNPGARTELVCEGAGSPNASAFTLGLAETNGARAKTFSIHAAAGIPQIN